MTWMGGMISERPPESEMANGISAPERRARERDSGSLANRAGTDGANDSVK